MDLTKRLGLALPIVQAPMAGVATPALVAAVSNAGGLGSLGLGSSDVGSARAAIDAVRAQTRHAFNVNLFVHRAPVADLEREVAWLARLAPLFTAAGVAPPAALAPPYRSFRDDPAMLAMLLETAPPVVSFHFGLPPAAALAALRDRGSLLIASATSPAEARAVAAAGIDAVVAQGIEAGGHRGVFDPEGVDDALGTFALTRLLAHEGALPVIAAGGIMDGAGIAAALRLGAVAAQLGTAFIGCTESAADAAYRTALAGPGAAHTRLVSVISGRPARTLASRFTVLADEADLPVPDYPIAYAAAKALHAAASARGDHGFAAHWAGQGAPLARFLPAAELMAALARELAAAHR